MPDKKDEPKIPLCFVVGPIGSDGSEVRKHADMMLHALVKQVISDEKLGYHVKRADEDTRPGMISDKIIHDILNAELVIADLTDLNANAFYELGIRHATEKPTIHIAKLGTTLPFDNFGHDTIFVDVGDWHNLSKARIRLASSIKNVIDSDYRVSNPITQANASFKMKQSSDSTDQLLVEVRSRLANLEHGRPFNQFPMRPPQRTSQNVRKINKFNRDVSSILSKNRDRDFLDSLIEIEEMALGSNLDFRFIVDSDDSVIYEIDGLRVDMKRDGQGFSHPTMETI